MDEVERKAEEVEFALSDHTARVRDYLERALEGVVFTPRSVDAVICRAMDYLSPDLKWEGGVKSTIQPDGYIHAWVNYKLHNDRTAGHRHIEITLAPP